MEVTEEGEKKENRKGKLMRSKMAACFYCVTYTNWVRTHGAITFWATLDSSPEIFENRILGLSQN